MSVDVEAAARAIEAFLTALGHPPSSDPELQGTGKRVAEAYAQELLAGYAEDPAAILADATASEAPGLVVVTDVQTTTMCPHHLLPASGVSHVGYLPGGSVVGLGALARVVHCFSRRLILQEDLGAKVAEALVTHLGAKAAACALDLSPTCMTARGEREHAARAVTIAYAGDADDAFRRSFEGALMLGARGARG
ncbi:MAG: GTP cyclohydrolase I [Sandaracinus sp.]|nr:GTP cyclohydrolase I [Sandaracinus sp.]MCB9615134.1 GTP cyclohydrolase I [Sandaracinus sp.]